MKAEWDISFAVQQTANDQITQNLTQMSEDKATIQTQLEEVQVEFEKQSLVLLELKAATDKQINDLQAQITQDQEDKSSLQKQIEIFSTKIEELKEQGEGQEMKIADLEKMKARLTLWMIG